VGPKRCRKNLGKDIKVATLQIGEVYEST